MLNFQTNLYYYSIYSLKTFIDINTCTLEIVRRIIYKFIACVECLYAVI